MAYRYGAVHPYEDSSIIVNEKRNTLRIWAGRLILGTIVIGVVAAATTLARMQSSVPTMKSFKAHPTSLKAFTTKFKSAAPYTSAGTQFTTYRDGYSVLEYFTESPSKFLKYKILDGYAGIIEPHANMHVQLYGVDSSTSSKYTYTVCDEGKNCDTFNFDDTFSYGCTPSQAYSLTVKTKTDEVVASGSLLCIYVRREIRSMTKSDLQTAVNAIWTMWSTSQEEGEALYGSNFLNYARLLEYHYFNAGWQDSDHIHEGKGFLPQHMKMIFYFSKSLTAVDPSVALFYWDFTYEPSKGLSHWDGPIFTNETMGTLPFPANGVYWTYANDTVEDGAIRDGLWKNFQTDPNTKFTDLKYGYGLMRSPWNMNPATFITRFTDMARVLPTCESHYELTDIDDFGDYLRYVLYAPHSTTHGCFGGVFGCDLLDSFRDAGYTDGDDGKLEVCSQWVFHLEVMYRANQIVPKTDCSSVDENGDYSLKLEHQNCGYTCPDENQDDMLTYLEDNMRGLPKHMGTKGYKAYREFICEGDGYKIFGGDHVESASPADPSFWPMHPTLERILHAKIMSGFDMSQWPTEDICDYSTCYDSELGFGEWDSCCYGHYEHDQLLDADNDDRSVGAGLTNREMLEAADPTSSDYAMDYIYDGFTWDHCADIGYDIVDLLNSNYEEFYGLDSTTDKPK